MAIPDVTTYFNAAKDYVLAYLMTDTCKIYPTTMVNDGTGSYTETKGSYRLYNGVENIPCRLDQTRLFREANIFFQETTPTDYYFTLPADVTIEVNDRIEHGGQVYDIKKLSDDSTWRASKKAYVVSTR